MHVMSRNEFVRRMCRDNGIPEESEIVSKKRKAKIAKKKKHQVDMYQADIINRIKYGRFK